MAIDVLFLWVQTITRRTAAWGERIGIVYGKKNSGGGKARTWCYFRGGGGGRSENSATLHYGNFGRRIRKAESFRLKGEVDIDKCLPFKSIKRTRSPRGRRGRMGRKLSTIRGKNQKPQPKNIKWREFWGPPGDERN